MKRKLYALLVLIGALGALLLAYLYFFVYYTGTLTINLNVESYSVKLYSPGTAQQRTQQCPDKTCIIEDVAPFDYNISISKQDYETKVISYDARPRGNETLVEILEKRVILDQVTSSDIETSQQKIQRLRDEKLYYAVFSMSETQKVRFKLEDDQLLLQYIKNGNLRDIRSFSIVPKQEILVTPISESSNFLIILGNQRFIFDTDFFNLELLPEIVGFSYIKYDPTSDNYIVITSNGAFVYDQKSGSVDFQYLFKDYVRYENFLIGVVFSDEKQKRQNFGITQKENVVVKYSQSDKSRKVIYATNRPVDQIYKKGDQIFIVSGESEFELKNFD